MSEPLDVRHYFEDPTPPQAVGNRRARPGRVSAMADGLVGSEILKIAGDIRAALAAGQQLCNLTVGDFNPRLFRIPEELERGIAQAYRDAETNYPPSDGVPVLREAVARYYARHLGLDYPTSCVLIAAGGRPVIYTAYRAIVDPGDHVVYPVPSWNNNHYAHMCGAVGVPVVCPPESNFLPTREQLEPVVHGARLIALCSPLNPAGTLFGEEQLAAICDLVLEENARRGRYERPLYVLYDHIYWTLTFGGARHFTPVGLRPRMARYTVFVDGVSKSLAATGVRVGWTAGPPDVIERMSGILGHVGAWAPRPEQVAVARLLEEDAVVDAFLERFKPAVEERLVALHEGLAAMASRGLPVRVLPPRAGIYLSACFDLLGARTPDGATLDTAEDVRRHLLEAAGMAVVPFSAFGATDETGWFRLSVGAVTMDEIAALLPRLEAALAALTPSAAGAVRGDLACPPGPSA